MRFILLIASLALTACSGSGGSSTPQNKALASVWTNTSSGFEMDLRTVVREQNQVISITGTTGSCSCVFYASGSDTQGTYNLSSCSTTSGSINCSLLNGSGTYTKTATELSVCDSGGCVTYR